jgi:hypothetical protein
MDWLHPGYIHQTLRGRGVPPPPKRDIVNFIASLRPEAASVEAERVRRISMGVDRSDDVECLLDAIKAKRPEESAPEALKPLVSKPPARVASAAPAEPHTEFLRSHGVHIYGQSAALKIELDTLRTSDEQAGGFQYTVLIEGANNRKGGGYNWTTKVPFQLTRRELPLVAAFLLGFTTEKLEFNNHGPQANKFLTLEDQGGKILVRVGQAGRAPVPVPVEPADVFSWGELCIVALQLNRPTVGAEGQLALLRRVGRMRQQPKGA